MGLAAPIFSSQLEPEIYIGPGVYVNERLARFMCTLQESEIRTTQSEIA